MINMNKAISEPKEKMIGTLVDSEELVFIDRAVAKDQRTRSSFIRKAILEKATKILENEPSKS